MSPAATRDTYTPAGLGRRLAAIAYDLLLLVGLAMLTGFVALALQYLADGAAEPQPAGGVLFQLALLAVTISYFTGCWHWLGQTPGMRAWGLALLNERGQRGGLLLCVLRFFAALLCWLPLGCGYWWGLLDRRQRCWHDHWTGLLVLRLPSPR